mmetsp:Transcript_118022/g.328095  ORF Transcript_118022/g.328095 Transcript_118022/m.328095 type:complete len:226 (-) Transcript_118022:452-1129(-)
MVDGELAQLRQRLRRRRLDVRFTLSLGVDSAVGVEMWLAQRGCSDGSGHARLRGGLGGRWPQQPRADRCERRGQGSGGQPSVRESHRLDARELREVCPHPPRQARPRRILGPLSSQLCAVLLDGVDADLLQRGLGRLPRRFRDLVTDSGVDGLARQHRQRASRSLLAKQCNLDSVGFAARVCVDGIFGSGSRPLDGVRDGHSQVCYSMPMLGARLGYFAGARLWC